LQLLLGIDELVANAPAITACSEQLDKNLRKPGLKKRSGF